MNLADFLYSFSSGSLEIKEGGYITQQLHGDMELLRKYLNLELKQLEAYRIIVPNGKFVPEHMHYLGIEYFIPIDKLNAEIEGKKIETQSPFKVGRGVRHGFPGSQLFYAIKEYDHEFDKVFF